MPYTLKILPTAEEDLAFFRKHNKDTYIKCFDIIRAISHDPRSGIGKPEKLRYFEGDVWSRRVNLEDRIVYTIYESIKEVDISSCKGHYE
jgi:toxin YoeB